MCGQAQQELDMAGNHAIEGESHAMISVSAIGGHLTPALSNIKPVTARIFSTDSSLLPVYVETLKYQYTKADSYLPYRIISRLATLETCSEVLILMPLGPSNKLNFHAFLRCLKKVVKYPHYRNVGQQPLAETWVMD